MSFNYKKYLAEGGIENYLLKETISKDIIPPEYIDSLPNTIKKIQSDKPSLSPIYDSIPAVVDGPAYDLGGGEYSNQQGKNGNNTVVVDLEDPSYGEVDVEDRIEMDITKPLGDVFKKYGKRNIVLGNVVAHLDNLGSLPNNINMMLADTLVIQDHLPSIEEFISKVPSLKLVKYGIIDIDEDDDDGINSAIAVAIFKK